MPRWSTSATGEVRRGQVVVVRDGRIESVGTAPPAVATAPRRLDLAGRYVLPGLIDAHVHIATAAALRAALESGVTTVRSAGVVALRRRGPARTGQARRSAGPRPPGRRLSRTAATRRRSVPRRARPWRPGRARTDHARGTPPIRSDESRAYGRLDQGARDGAGRHPGYRPTQTGLLRGRARRGGGRGQRPRRAGARPRPRRGRGARRREGWREKHRAWHLSHRRDVEADGPAWRLLRSDG